MNLFLSFILRAISVFIKDGVLYAKEDSEHCFIHTVSNTNSPAYVHTKQFISQRCRFFMPRQMFSLLTVLSHPPSLCLSLPEAGVSSSDDILPLLRPLKLLLALHRGSVPLHFTGGDLLPWKKILLLVHHHWLGWDIERIIHYGSFSVDPVLLTHFCSNRNPHSVCDHLGSAEAPLWWYRVGYERYLVCCAHVDECVFTVCAECVITCFLRCWDLNDSAAIWWVIKGPVLASIMVGDDPLSVW